MPICTSCTAPVTHLYTVYASRHNLRLEPCPTCHAFADPYVEHDALTLVLDLLLLKRAVYRHLLFNRGLGARRADTKPGPDDDAKRVLARRRWERDRGWLIVKLGLALVVVDAFIRWTYLHPTPIPGQEDEQWTADAALAFFRIFIGCFAETLAFHAGITLASWIVLSCMHGVRKLFGHDPASITPPEFSYAQIPLTLLYSSLPKLFLLLLLSLWRASSSDPPASGTAPSGLTAAELISRALEHADARPLAAVLDDGVLDRAWVVRNILGGMAAGFGLRVVLAGPPVAASAAVLAGWAARTAAARSLGPWVGGDAERGAAWLAYSIP